MPDEMEEDNSGDEGLLRPMACDQSREHCNVIDGLARQMA